MSVKLSRDPGTPIKYPSLNSCVERSRDPETITYCNIFIVETMNKYQVHMYHANKTLQIRPIESHFT